MPVHKQIESLTKKITTIETEIDASQRQMKELEHTITLKQKFVVDLISNNDMTSKANQRFHKKKNKLESEYEKTKKALSKALLSGDKIDIERLKLMTSHIEHRLQKLASIKDIADENGQTLKKWQKSLQDSQKELGKMQKSLKKQKKTKESLENKLKEEKSKEKKLLTLERGKKNLKSVATRISHLDYVLKEKSQTLEQNSVAGEKESLRHEIRHLRLRKDHLIKQRCHLDKNRKKQPISQTDERRLLECDGAIEAIDYAIEGKNELICGQKVIDTSEKIQREKGKQMLMEILNLNGDDEKKNFIYKYHVKVIDLRESCRKLERESDEWERRARFLSNKVEQARLEGERHAVQLQQYYETKVALMLRHLADETSTNSSLTDHRFIPSTTSSNYPKNDFNIDFYKPGANKHYQLQQHHYRPPKPTDLDFHKIQVRTRYHGSDKRKMAVESLIPHENLKQLQSSAVPMTKVTREKNKLIIQQNPPR